jgi:hypothetical protein
MSDVTRASLIYHWALALTFPVLGLADGEVLASQHPTSAITPAAIYARESFKAQ